MPNWCNNEIIITGDQSTLTKLHERLLHDGRHNGNEEFSFTTFVPIPEAFQASDLGECWVTREHGEVALIVPTVSDEGVVTWGERGSERMLERVALTRFGTTLFGEDALANPVTAFHPYSALWDTKWDANYAKVHLSEERMVITFGSAWSPPLQVIRRMRELLEPLGLRMWFRAEESGMNFFVEIDEDGFMTEGELSTQEDEDELEREERELELAS